MLNILDLRDTYEIGGPGKTIIETYKALDQSRFRMHLGVFSTRAESTETPFVMAAKNCGMPVHSIRGFNQYDPAMVWRLIELVKAMSVDIVHAHEVKSDVITCLAAKLYPMTIVTTLHGWIGNSLKRRLLTAVDKRIMGQFDRVFVVSRKIGEELAAVGVSSSRVRLIHNAIVTERYRRMGRRGVLADVIGCQIPHPVISAIGRLSPEKGHSDLIEAMAIVKACGHKVSLILIGDGPERQKLLRQIQALDLEDSVHLPGYINQPERLLEEIDLTVLPSKTEGLPNAVLESLMMEVPVLATSVGGTPEIITDGETGRLVPPGSPNALAEGIMEFLANVQLWKAMAMKGKAVVEAQFDFKARTRQLEALYTELVPR